jgi:predicted nucleotidyltransferase
VKPSTALEQHRAEIRQLIQAKRAENPRVFGSVARGEDTEESDLNILVDMGAAMTYFDLFRMRDGLTKLLGVRVDVRTPGELPDRHRAEVISLAKPV